MNKQEFQETIQKELPKTFSALTLKEAFNEGFNSAITMYYLSLAFLIL